MFLQLGNQWINLEQIVRVEFNADNTATLYFAKPGGSDRHFLSLHDAQTLKEYLEQQRDLASPKKRKPR